MDARSVEKILLAAANVAPVSWRESCCVGGVVRSLLDRARFDSEFATHTAWALIGMGQSMVRDNCGTGTAIAVFPDVSMPTKAEMQSAVRKFYANYDPPAVAA